MFAFSETQIGGVGMKSEEDKKGNKIREYIKEDHMNSIRFSQSITFDKAATRIQKGNPTSIQSISF